MGTKQLAALWVVACATTARTQQVEITGRFTGGTGAYRGAKGNYKFTGTAPSGSTTVTGTAPGPSLTDSLKDCTPLRVRAARSSPHQQRRCSMSIAGANPMLRKFAAGICALLVAGLGAGTASAGEVTGNGNVTGARTHASSICAYSGQNDHPEAPLSLDPDVAPNGPGGRTQSFGQDVKLGADPHVFNPGDACGHDTNPNRL